MTFKKWSKDGREPINVTPCCMMMNPVTSEEDGSVKHHSLGHGSLKGLSPEEIFNHESFEKLRNDLSNGIKNEACTVCWRMEEDGLESFRQCSDSSDPPHPNQEGLFEFDITLSNLCNLACRMCNVGSSHQLGKDVEKMKAKGLHNSFMEVSNNAMPDVKGVIYDKDNNSVIDWLLDNTHKITMLKASGGEPFYDRRVVKVLERYVETEASKNTILKFHTNATQFTPELVNLLNNFTNIIKYIYVNIRNKRGTYQSLLFIPFFIIYLENLSDQEVGIIEVISLAKLFTFPFIIKYLP